MEVKIKKLFEDAKIPTCGSEYSAGYDMYAHIEDGDGKLTIAPHTTQMVHTGVATAIPIGYFGAVFARSGLSKKQGLRPANCVGVIDAMP